jgi:hypothetical protein
MIVRKRFSYLLLFWFLFFCYTLCIIIFKVVTYQKKIIIFKVVYFMLHMRKMVERKHIYVTKLIFIPIGT